MRRWIGLAVLAIHLGCAEAAIASTLPRVDFEAGDKTVAAGALDVNFDYAFTDRLSLGASLIPMPEARHWTQPVLSPLFTALRATYRLGEWGPETTFGLTLSSGVTMNPIILNCSDCLDLSMGLPYLFQGQYVAWVQPALNVTVRLDERIRMRATLGPLFLLNGPRGFEPQFSPVPFPNLEFAYKLNESQEITVLGNALVGWRGVF